MEAAGRISDGHHHTLEPHACPALDVSWQTPNGVTLKDMFGVFVFETQHDLYINASR